MTTGHRISYPIIYIAWAAYEPTGWRFGGAHGVLLRNCVFAKRWVHRNERQPWRIRTIRAMKRQRSYRSIVSATRHPIGKFLSDNERAAKSFGHESHIRTHTHTHTHTHEVADKFVESWDQQVEICHGSHRRSIGVKRSKAKQSSFQHSRPPHAWINQKSIHARLVLQSPPSISYRPRHLTAGVIPFLFFPTFLFLILWERLFALSMVLVGGALIQQQPFFFCFIFQ